MSDGSGRDDGISEYNRIAACCIGGEMHGFCLVVDCVNLPDSVRKEVGGACCVKSGVLHDAFSIFEVNVHPLVGGFQEETEGDQKFAFWQSDARDLLVRPTIEVPLLQFTSIISYKLALLACLLHFIDLLAESSNCLLETIGLTDLPIFAQQNHLLNRLKERRIDLHLNLQKHLISNDLIRKPNTNIRVGSLQCLDHSIRPNDF